MKDDSTYNLIYYYIGTLYYQYKLNIPKENFKYLRKIVF